MVIVLEVVINKVVIITKVVVFDIDESKGITYERKIIVEKDDDN